MKTDKYTKVVLTIIALCLVWISVKLTTAQDVKVTNQVSTRIDSVNGRMRYALPVKVDNWP